MDDRTLARLRLTMSSDDDVVTAGMEDACTRIELRIATAELAELVDAVELDRPDPSVEPDRALLFASASQRVAVAVDTTDRVAVGRLDPAVAGIVTMVDAGGGRTAVEVDDDGAFEFVRVPAGYVQLVVEPDVASGRQSVRSAWTAFVEDEPTRASTTARLDELRRRTLAGRVDALLDLQRSGSSVTRRRSGRRRGSLHPPVPVVGRVLPAAAQISARPLPSHRWRSDVDRVEVVLEETAAGRLVLSVIRPAGTAATAIACVAWTTTNLNGGVDRFNLVTPLPIERSELRVASYDVGSAIELREFGLVDVRIDAGTTATVAALEATAVHRPFGNAVRAWDELTIQRDDPLLRAAYEGWLGRAT